MARPFAWQPEMTSRPTSLQARAPHRGLVIRRRNTGIRASRHPLRHPLSTKQGHKSVFAIVAEKLVSSCHGKIPVSPTANQPQRQAEELLSRLTTSSKQKVQPTRTVSDPTTTITKRNLVSNFYASPSNGCWPRTDDCSNGTTTMKVTQRDSDYTEDAEETEADLSSWILLDLDQKSESTTQRKTTVCAETKEQSLPDPMDEMNWFGGEGVRRESDHNEGESDCADADCIPSKHVQHTYLENMIRMKSSALPIQRQVTPARDQSTLLSTAHSVNDCGRTESNPKVTASVPQLQLIRRFNHCRRSSTSRASVTIPRPTAINTSVTTESQFHAKRGARTTAASQDHSIDAPQVKHDPWRAPREAMIRSSPKPKRNLPIPCTGGALVRRWHLAPRTGKSKTCSASLQLQRTPSMKERSKKFEQRLKLLGGVGSARNAARKEAVLTIKQAGQPTKCVVSTTALGIARRVILHLQTLDTITPSLLCWWHNAVTAMLKKTWRSRTCLCDHCAAVAADKMRIRIRVARKSSYF